MKKSVFHRCFLLRMYSLNIISRCSKDLGYSIYYLTSPRQKKTFDCPPGWGSISGPFNWPSSVIELGVYLAPFPIYPSRISVTRAYIHARGQAHTQNDTPDPTNASCTDDWLEPGNTSMTHSYKARSHRPIAGRSMTSSALEPRTKNRLTLTMANCMK
jgi:hypothetical protein